MFRDEIWDPTTDIDIKELVKAAVDLSEFFPSMKDALEFNVYQGSTKVKNQCQDGLETKAKVLLKENRQMDLESILNLIEEPSDKQGQVEGHRCD